MFVNGNMGFYKIANYLSLQGVKKVKRDNGTLAQWSNHFIRMIIDSLPEDTRFRERKLHDMTLRLDGLYNVIVELEEKIEDVKLRRKAVEQDAITLENIYTLLANFEKVYDKISDEEKNGSVYSFV